MTTATYGNKSDNPVYTSGQWKKPENMRNLVSFVVLMVCTLGIYFFYWVFKTTEYANRDRNSAQQSPLVQLLLVMFIPYYELYWFYKTSKKLSNLGEPFEVFNDNSIVTLILAIFGLDIIGAVILQDQINRIEAVRSGAGPNTTGEGVCRNCHATFPNDVHACPHCGESYKKPFTQTVWFPIVIGALGLLLAIGLLIGGIVALSSNAELTEDGSWNWDEITSGEEAAGPGYEPSDIDELIDENSQKYGEVIDRFLPGDASVLIRADNDFLPADSGTIDSILRLLSMGVVSQNVGLEVTDDGNGNVALASAEGYKFTTFGIKLKSIIRNYYI